MTRPSSPTHLGSHGHTRQLNASSGVSNDDRAQANDHVHDEATPLLSPRLPSSGSAQGSDDAAKLAALFAVPWYRRAPLVQVLICTLLPLLALIASIPTQSQVVLNWACDAELAVRQANNVVPVVPAAFKLETAAAADPRAVCFPKPPPSTSPASGGSMATASAALLADNDGLGLAVQQRASSVLATATLLLSITTMFTTSVWGKCTDTFGRLPVLRAGMLSFAALTSCSLSYVVLPTHWNPWTTYALSLVSGLLGGMSTFDIAISAYLTDLTTDDERASMFGLVQGLMAGVSMLAPVVGAWIVWMTYGSPVPLLVGALALVGVAIFALAFGWEPKRTMPALTRHEAVAMVLNPFASLSVFRLKWAPGALYRIFLLAVAVGGGLVMGLIENVWTLYTSFNFGWGQLDWSVLMTIGSGVSAGLLVVGYPIVAKVFHKYAVVPKLPGVPEMDQEEEEVTIAVDDLEHERVKTGTVDSETVVEHAATHMDQDTDDHDWTLSSSSSSSDPLVASSSTQAPLATKPGDLRTPTRTAELDPLSVYDDHLSATRLDTPAIAFSCLLSLLGLVLQAFAHSGGVFFAGALLRTFTALVQPIRSAMLTRLVPRTHTGQMFSAMSLVMAGVAVPTPMVANWIYRRSLEARLAEGANGVLLPGADVFLVAAGVAGVALILSLGAAVGVEVLRRRHERAGGEVEAR